MQQIYLALILFYTFQVEERMDIDKFSAHGEVHAHFQAEQNILHIDLVGPFNLEFMQKYERVVGAQRKNIDTRQWCFMNQKVWQCKRSFGLVFMNLQH